MLSENMSFVQHNLLSDQSFNEFRVIFCRNEMIYFDHDLQEHAMHLLHKSLAAFGYLGLGSKESIFPTHYRETYVEQGDGTRLFQLRN